MPTPLSLRLRMRRRLLQVLLAVSLVLCALSTASVPMSVSAQTPCPPPLVCQIPTGEACPVRQTGSAPGRDAAATLEKFVDPLPLPAAAQPVASHGRLDSRFCSERGDRHGPSDCPPLYHFTLAQTTQKLHRDLPPTVVYGYSSGGPGAPVTYPGPTIEARSGSPIQVRWENRLPRCHILPVDPTIAEPDHAACELLRTQSRAVTHLHGGHTEAKSDGHPEAWYTSSNHLPTGQLLTGPMFSGNLYRYDNSQPATNLWYHDHALFITRLNVQAGLAGLFMIRDRWEDSLKLPRGSFEIPLVIQDRSFNANGSLFYPSEPADPPTSCPQPNPSVVPEFFGDAALVNGMVWPQLSVQPRQYRLRFLNGANSRFFNLRLEVCATPLGTCATTAAGPTLVQIGSDQGFLAAAKPVVGGLLLGPAERADILVDFSAFAGESLLLSNDAPSPFQQQVASDPTNPGPPAPLREIMRIDVAAYSAGCSKPTRPAAVPRLPPFERLREADSKATRIFTLDEATDAFGRLLLLMNRTPFEAAVADHPNEGDVEVWGFKNTTPDVHPMHIHLVRFQLLRRVKFDAAAPDFSPSVADEFGWKDTILSPPGFTTFVIARFDRPGPYVVHCHILEHEDHDMMRPYIVVGQQCKKE